jgi:hypothetical protein
MTSITKTAGKMNSHGTPLWRMPSRRLSHIVISPSPGEDGRVAVAII